MPATRAVVGKCLFTEVLAFSAFRTFVAIKEQFGTRRLRFGIMTPYTAQIAALEKDCRPYTVAVMERKALYTENSAFTGRFIHHKPFSVREIMLF